MSKVFREWFDTVDKNSQEWLDFVKQQEQDDEMSAQILEDMECKEQKKVHGIPELRKFYAETLEMFTVN